MTAQLTRLVEKPIQARIELFIERSLFQLALSAGRTSELDEAEMADIHRRSVAATLRC